MLLVSFSKKKKVVAGFNLDLLLISLFYSLIITWYIKFVVKFCGHNILTLFLFLFLRIIITLFFNVRFIACWHDLLKSTSLSKISLKLKISIKPNQLHYPTWNPWLKITERPLFKHPVKTSKGFGDFKHPLKRIWGF